VLLSGLGLAIGRHDVSLQSNALDRHLDIYGARQAIRIGYQTVRLLVQQPQALRASGPLIPPLPSSISERTLTVEHGRPAEVPGSLEVIPIGLCDCDCFFREIVHHTPQDLLTGNAL